METEPGAAARARARAAAAAAAAAQDDDLDSEPDTDPGVTAGVLSGMIGGDQAREVEPPGSPRQTERMARSPVDAHHPSQTERGHRAGRAGPGPRDDRSGDGGRPRSSAGDRADATLLMTPIPRDLDKPRPAPRTPRSYALPPGVVAPGPLSSDRSSVERGSMNGEKRRTLTGIAAMKPGEAVELVPAPPVLPSSLGPTAAATAAAASAARSGNPAASLRPSSRSRQPSRPAPLARKPITERNDPFERMDRADPGDHMTTARVESAARAEPAEGIVRGEQRGSPSRGERDGGARSEGGARSDREAASARDRGARAEHDGAARGEREAMNPREVAARAERHGVARTERAAAARAERETTARAERDVVGRAGRETAARAEHETARAERETAARAEPDSARAGGMSSPPGEASSPPAPVARAERTDRRSASLPPPHRPEGPPLVASSPPAAASAAPVHVDRVTTAEDRAELRALFTELAGHHMVQLRDFMIEVRCGSALADWIGLSEPAVRSVRSMAEQLELDDVCVALDRLLAALVEARQAGGAIDPGHQAGLLAAYLPLVDLLPGVLELDAERNRREPIIVHSILRQIPGVEKLAIDKLVAANLVAVASLADARPEELAQVTGLDRELAERVVARFREYRLEAGAVATPDPRAELRALEGLAGRLRQQNQDFDFASGSWAPGIKERKRELRRERAATLLAIHVSLARLGEVDRLVELDRLNFRRKVEFIDVTLQAARAAARARTGNPA